MNVEVSRNLRANRFRGIVIVDGGSTIKMHVPGPLIRRLTLLAEDPTPFAALAFLTNISRRGIP